MGWRIATPDIFSELILCLCGSIFENKTESYRWTQFRLYGEDGALICYPIFFEILTLHIDLMDKQNQTNCIYLLSGWLCLSFKLL